MAITYAVMDSAQKMKFSVKNFSSKCDLLQLRSHLLEKSLMENFILCVVYLKLLTYAI